MNLVDRYIDRGHRYIGAVSLFFNIEEYFRSHEMIILSHQPRVNSVSVRVNQMPLHATSYSVTYMQGTGMVRLHVALRYEDIISVAYQYEQEMEPWQ